MKIGIIGAGKIGSTAARLFAEAGHEVALSNSRGPETLAPLVEEIGPKARAVTAEEAADFGDVVLEAIPFKDYASLPALPRAAARLRPQTRSEHRVQRDRQRRGAGVVVTARALLTELDASGVLGGSCD